MSFAAIEVNNLSKRYGDLVALNNASFEVPLGTICGFVGPNGSGKTTTIRMLLGLIKPSAGTGSIIGNSISHPERYLNEVGALIEVMVLPVLTSIDKYNRPCSLIMPSPSLTIFFW